MGFEGSTALCVEAEGNPDGENCVGGANTDWTYLGNKFGSRDGRMEGEYRGEMW